ncbi:MAG: hypothetical protein A2284_10915 [Deltaproteobacteria bacterium RIFOXYA12_FULL_61_11]|nr:MAG: hypothetical protein A2284_10915 [Deltaproteobacteria bacterium RIFOXYA12_FULL_61_11]
MPTHSCFASFLSALEHDEAFLSFLDDLGERIEPAAVFKAIEHKVGELLGSSGAAKLHACLPGITPEALRRALSDRDFSGIVDTHPRYREVLELLHERFAFEQELFSRFVPGLELHLHEKLLCMSFNKLCSVFDELYLAWRDVVCDSPLGRSIRAAEETQPGSATARLKELGLENAYSVITSPTGQVGLSEVSPTWKQVPYALAFPEQYRKLDGLLDRLLLQLGLHRGEHPEVPVLLTYLASYRAALAETDPKKLEERWRQVDIDWMAVTGRLQPCHAMETGYSDPGRLRVVPELRLLLVDDTEKEVNLACDGTKQAMQEYLGRHYGDRPFHNEYQEALRHTHAHVYVTVYKGGANLDFRIAGQIVPNRSEVRRDHGTKISLDLQSLASGMAISLRLAERLLGPAFAEAYLRRVTPLKAEAYFVAGHEYGHTAFLGTASDELVKDLVEEAKASWTGLAVLRDRMQRGEVPRGDLADILLFEVAGSLRRLVRETRTRGAVRPYVEEAYMTLALMLQSGLLVLEGERLSLDEERVEAFAEQLDEAHRRLAEAYLDLDQGKLDSFLATQADRTLPAFTVLERLVDAANQA